MVINRSFTYSLAFLCATVAMALLFSPVSAEFFIKGTDLTEDEFIEYLQTTEPEYVENSIIYFYDPGCGSCIPAHEFLENYILENPDTEILMFDLTESEKNREMFDEKKTEFERSPVFIPVLYIGPVALEGFTEIEEFFEETYQWYIKSKPNLDN